MFSVNDGGGMSLKMSSEGRERIAATYHRFILSNSGIYIALTKHLMPFPSTCTYSNASSFLL